MKKLAIVFMLLSIITGCATTSPLIKATMKGDTPTIQKLLNEGANVNERDKNGWGPLIYAIEYGRYDLMQILIEKGADIEAKDYIGETPLVYAVLRKEDFKAAKILIKNGANLSARCYEGETVTDVIFTFTFGENMENLGFDLWRPEPGKARLIFIGTVLFDYLKVTVGQQTKRLNQGMYIGSAYIDIEAGTHSIYVNEFHDKPGSGKSITSVDAKAGQIYCFKVTQDMKRRAAHYAGMKLASVYVTPFTESETISELAAMRAMNKNPKW
jgi:hypothetical protein